MIYHSVLTTLMVCAFFSLTSLCRQSLFPPILSRLAIHYHREEQSFGYEDGGHVA